MEVKILKEIGYEEALLGMSLSYYDHKTPLDEWWTYEKMTRAERRASSLAFKGGGHSKFLESITLYIYIKAARSFWVDFDTYRVGITKQSASTMHTLDKRLVTADDFETGTSNYMITGFNDCLRRYWKKEMTLTQLKDNLPEGWLQERVVVTNYKTLQNIIYQRKTHRLEYFKIFCKEILAQAAFPEFLHQPDL